MMIANPEIGNRCPAVTLGLDPRVICIWNLGILTIPRRGGGMTTVHLGIYFGLTLVYTSCFISNSEALTSTKQRDNEITVIQI